MRLQEVLKQGQYVPMAFSQMVTVLYAVTNSFADHVDVAHMKAWEDGLHKFMASTYPNVGRGITEKRTLDAEASAALDEALKAYNASWSPEAIG
jgi:F-type H+-transporting ATPase subunit alpha